MIVAIAFVVWSEFRRRASARKLGAEPVPTSVAVTRVVLFSAVIAYLTYLYGSGRVGTSFPVPALVLVLLVVVYQFVASRTITGRHVYAVGGNRAAAALSPGFSAIARMSSPTRPPSIAAERSKNARVTSLRRTGQA